MKLGLCAAAAASALLALMPISDPALAQKQGGILKMYHRDSPGSASIHEEATYSNNVPFMPVFNNLVFYKQDVPQNSLQSIVPELATDWAWSPDNSKLTFNLRGGVKWHDGKPFTAKDVVCTFDMLMDKGPAKFRKNPRKTWYENVSEVTATTDAQVVFTLKRPQPALLALLASGYTAPARLSSSPSSRTNRLR
jgi:peptide/nickel transport system substrate-binding protein